jgi:hypothetical protein
MKDSSQALFVFLRYHDHAYILRCPRLFGDDHSFNNFEAGQTMSAPNNLQLFKNAGSQRLDVAPRLGLHFVIWHHNCYWFRPIGRSIDANVRGDLRGSIYRFQLESVSEAHIKG